MIYLLITNRNNRELTTIVYLNEIDNTLEDLEKIVNCYSHFCDIELKRVCNV